MIIKGIFVPSTNEILYSRTRHDCRTSEDNQAGIDGGFDYHRYLGDPKQYVMLDIDGDVLLQQILEYDWKYKNKNADKFPNGYLGRFKITPQSNIEFYKKLILNFNDIAEYFKKDKCELCDSKIVVYDGLCPDCVDKVKVVLEKWGETYGN